MFDNNIKISIITINFNNVHGLSQTYESVKNQNYDNIEYIIIDGNSTDGSVSFLQEKSESIDFLTIENDRGIYDAMNKGLKHCTGEFCLFLNSGDYFITEYCLSMIFDQIDDINKVYFSKAKITNGNVEWFVPSNDMKISKWLKSNSPNHQTILFPKDFYMNNRYDLFYKIVGDVDFIEKAKCSFEFKYIPIVSVVFDLGGISNNTASFKRIKRQILESLVVHLKYFPNKLFNVFYVPAKFLLKFIIGFLLRTKYDKFLKTVNRIK